MSLGFKTFSFVYFSVTQLLFGLGHCSYDIILFDHILRMYSMYSRHFPTLSCNIAHDSILGCRKACRAFSRKHNLEWFELFSFLSKITPRYLTAWARLIAF